MSERSGLYPRVRVDARGSGVVSQAGGLLLVDAIGASGFDAGLSEALAPWRKPLARHDPAKILLDLAVELALGGDCLADIALLRAQPGVFGLDASDPTVSRTIAALAVDAAKGVDGDQHCACRGPREGVGASRRARAGRRERRHR